MKKNQTRSKDLIEKSDYWKWNDNMCFNGVYLTTLIVNMTTLLLMENQ